MRRASTATAVFALCCALFLCGLPSMEPAFGDVVHLRTGKSIKGRPSQDRSDENTLVIEDYLGGGVRSLSWDVIDPADRDRLWVDWGWKNKARKLVPGHVVVIGLADGSTDPVRGLIESEDAQFIHLRRNGKLIKIEKSRVTEQGEEELDPREIWDEDQLYQRAYEQLVKDVGPVSSWTARDHFRIAENAEFFGKLDKAREHFQRAADDPEFMNANVAKQRLERVDALLRDQAALKELRDLKMALSLKSFPKVRDAIESFAERHPTASQPILTRLERFKKQYTEKRDVFFQEQAKYNFRKIVMRMITEKLKDDEVSLGDIRGWTRRELPEQAFEKLAALLQKKDPVITPTDARTFWDNRKKTNWWTSSYGSGTQFVDKPKIKPPKRGRSNKKKKRSGSSKAAPAIKTPKPPTQDQWWKNVSKPKERANWTMTYFVENSGELFEVSKKKYLSNCPLCNAVGLIVKRLQSGDTLAYLCNRCGGAQQDRKVRYR